MKSHDKRSAFIVCSLKIMTMRCRTCKYKERATQCTCTIYTLNPLHLSMYSWNLKSCNPSQLPNTIITLTSDLKIVKLGKSIVVLKHFGKPERESGATSLARWVREPAGLACWENQEPYLNLFTMTPIYTQYLATNPTTFWMKTAAIILGLAAAASSKFCPGERNGNQCVAGE